MIIRKLNKDKTLRLKTIVMFIFMIIFLIIIFFRYNSFWSQINFGTNNFSGSNGIDILGKVEKIEKGGYNEYFLINDRLRILLKNYPPNIDSILGNNVLINGEIKGSINTQFFFIKVLKDLDNNIIAEDNIYTFANELIVLNTKEMPSVVPYKQGSKIIIYYKNNPLIDISAFGCNKVSSARDCKQLIDDFDLHENEYFDSYNGLSYYKIDDNKWELFNGILLGYYIQTKDDSILLNISSVIDIINSNYILNNKRDILTNNCKDILNIDDIYITGHDGSIIIVDVRGKNTENKNIKCLVKFDLMNDRKVIKGY